jgi:hypothetical protein
MILYINISYKTHKSFSTHLSPIWRSYVFFKYTKAYSFIRSLNIFPVKSSKSDLYKKSFCHTIQLTNLIIKDILE